MLPLASDLDPPPMVPEEEVEEVGPEGIWGIIARRAEKAEAEQAEEPYLVYSKKYLTGWG